ncbi:MAG: cell wall metabolism sensor histidine kinase WalK [Lachnospiraceae bacterium]|nr:cell wall metabolism sensor histidine kinase WalK [Lachnospiraceae bacterium]
MQARKKEKLHNRLFTKVYINYASMVTLFAMILGIIFIQLYQNATIDNYRQQLFEQGRSIAKRFTEFIVNEDYDSRLEYLQILGEVLEVQQGELWTLSNPNASSPMNEKLVNVELDPANTSEEVIQIINGAFAGKEKEKIGFSDIHGYMMMTIGVPIAGANGEVVGAVLLNAKVADQKNLVMNSIYLILVSAIAALILSFVIAILFARQLTLPITKMRETALELAEGKYETKTGISRNDEIGDLARTIDFLTDKLMENEKIRKNLEQMRLDFFANVSHELRTPITVVRAYTESLVDGVVTDEGKRAQYYDKMLNECKSMERLVGDLLLLSKMQNPDFVIEKEPVNVIQIFDDISRSVKTIGEEKNISVEFKSNQEIAMMMGDYDRLRQMFLVILDNAVKFSGENSTIHIMVMSKSSKKLVISIRDEGIGIPKEELGSIFEKFYKSKLRQNAKGSGLGLAIARQIAVKHGGNIQVYSEVGVGTEFVFTFDAISNEELQQV